MARLGTDGGLDACLIIPMGRPCWSVLVFLVLDRCEEPRRLCLLKEEGLAISRTSSVALAPLCRIPCSTFCLFPSCSKASPVLSLSGGLRFSPLLAPSLP